MTAKAGEAIRRRTGLQIRVFFRMVSCLEITWWQGQFDLGGLEARVQFDARLRSA